MSMVTSPRSGSMRSLASATPGRSRRTGSSWSGCFDVDLSQRSVEAAALCLRRPYLFRLAGKDRGEKGRLVTVWCVLRVQFRQAPMLKSLRTHIVTLQTLLYAPPVTELRICEQLPLNGCDKSALHSKFVKQYGFAGAPQSLPLPRSAR